MHPDSSSRFSLILRALFSVFLGLQCIPSNVARAQDDYKLPPEAELQEGVPEGKIEGPIKFSSKIFPGTEREYWVYVPAAYDKEKPACTLVVQDGLNRAKGWRLPQVCDNLIHANEMPVTIGIYVSPGVVKSAKANSQPRFNRSFEYDAMGDRYARFLLEELIPEVGKKYNLSSDPNDRAIAGASSGGICAFNVAWERPDAFRRVLSTIGTFVGLRGANDFPTLVRKVEPKPIRVFMQDGSGDLDIYAGGWWTANQDMLAALRWAGYDVKNVWGTGGHNSKHAAAIMPEALRWLWRDYPEPIQTPSTARSNRRVDYLIENEDWKLISSGHEAAQAPACNAAGELFFSDPKLGRIFRVGPDQKTRIFADQVGRISNLSFSASGTLYAVRDGSQIVRFDQSGKESLLTEVDGVESVLAMPGMIYYSESATPAIHCMPLEGGEQKSMPLNVPVVAFAPTADHAFMHLISKNLQMTLHSQIGTAGELSNTQEYGYLHMPYTQAMSGASGIAVDVSGRFFVASNVGVQVFDQLGRVNIILKNPSETPVTGLSLGGEQRDTLYVTSGGSVYGRKLKTKGVFSFESPSEPPRPGL